MLQKSLKNYFCHKFELCEGVDCGGPDCRVYSVDSEMVNGAVTAPTNLPFTFFLLLLDDSRYLVKMITFTV